MIHGSYSCSNNYFLSFYENVIFDVNGIKLRNYVRVQYCPACHSKFILDKDTPADVETIYRITELIEDIYRRNIAITK